MSYGLQAFTIAFIKNDLLKHHVPDLMHAAFLGIFNG